MLLGHQCCSQVINRLRSYDHATQAAVVLYWLPAQAYIQYKLGLLVHHALAGTAAAYIIDLLPPVAATLSGHSVLRSANTIHPSNQPIVGCCWKSREGKNKKIKNQWTMSKYSYRFRNFGFYLRTARSHSILQRSLSYKH